MPNRFDEIAAEALGLSAQQRVLLAQRLILSVDSTSIDSDRESLWEEEVQRRLQRVQQGEVETIAEEDAMRRVR